MKSLRLFSNKGLNLLVSTLLIIGSRSQIVKTDECTDLENAINKFGPNVEQKFKEQQGIKNCCDYNQIKCTNMDDGLHITEIKLDNVNTFFKGSETDAIDILANLPYLSTLEITSSSQSKIPGNLDKLKNLKILRLSENNYSGTLPTEIGRLKNLEVLDFSKGFMTGGIPKEYCDLTNLKSLDLSGQRFSGAIPYCFKNLKKLEILKLQSNFDLEGYVPNLPNIGSCDYQFTNLCTLKSAKCTKGAKTCSAEAIKSTNFNNGNPDPNSTEFDNEEGSSNFSSDNDDSDPLSLFKSILKFVIFGVLIFIVLIILICVCIISGAVKVSQKKKNDNGKYNDLIANSNAPAPVDGTATVHGGGYNVTYTVASTEPTNKPDDDNNSSTSDDEPNPYISATEPLTTSSTTAPTTTTANASMVMPQPVVSPVATQPVATTAYVAQPMPGSYVLPTMPGPAYAPQMPGTAYVAQPSYMAYPPAGPQPGVAYAQPAVSYPPPQPGVAYPPQQPVTQPVAQPVTQPVTQPVADSAAAATNERPPSYSAL